MKFNEFISSVLKEFKVVDDLPTGHSWVRDFYASPGDPYMSKLLASDNCCEEQLDTTGERVLKRSFSLRFTFNRS